MRDRHSFSAARGLRSSFTSNLKGPNDKPTSVRFVTAPAQLTVLRLRHFLQTIKGKAIERFRDDRALEFARSDKGLAAPNGR